MRLPHSKGTLAQTHGFWSEVLQIEPESDVKWPFLGSLGHHLISLALNAVLGDLMGRKHINEMHESMRQSAR